MIGVKYKENGADVNLKMSFIQVESDLPTKKKRHPD
jgi:hypothetical protein